MSIKDGPLATLSNASTFRVPCHIDSFQYTRFNVGRPLYDLQPSQLYPNRSNMVPSMSEPSECLNLTVGFVFPLLSVSKDLILDIFKMHKLGLLLISFLVSILRS